MRIITAEYQIVSFKSNSCMFKRGVGREYLIVYHQLITRLMFAMENPQKSFGNLRFNNAKKYICFKASYQNKRQTEKYVY